MPKTVKGYAKKRRHTKRKRTTTVAKLAKKVSQLAKGIETKHLRTSGIGALPDNNPSLAIRPYQTISVGTSDYGTRIGDKITARFIKFKSVWTLVAGSGACTGRIVVFTYKHNPDSIATAWSTIWNLYAESTYANSVNVVNGNKDYDNRKGFTTIYDKKMTINPSDSAVATSKSWDFNILIPKTSQTVQFVNGASTVTQNEIFIALISENDTSLSVNYVHELYYSDQ